MKKEIYKCDRCGDDISPDKIMYGRRSHIAFTLEYWHGGSIGGEEDRDHFNYDLCEDCSRELSWIMRKWMKRELKIKED